MSFLGIDLDLLTPAERRDLAKRAAPRGLERRARVHAHPAPRPASRSRRSRGWGVIVSSPRAHRRNGVVSYSVRFPRPRGSPSGAATRGMNRARAEHDACKPDASGSADPGFGNPATRCASHVWTCDGRGYLLETPVHVSQIGRALDAGERPSESVGELARRARVQVALGRRETRMAHGGLHGGEVDRRPRPEASRRCGADRGNASAAIWRHHVLARRGAAAQTRRVGVRAG